MKNLDFNHGKNSSCSLQKKTTTEFMFASIPKSFSSVLVSVQSTARQALYVFVAQEKKGLVAGIFWKNPTEKSTETVASSFFLLSLLKYL